MSKKREPIEEIAGIEQLEKLEEEEGENPSWAMTTLDINSVSDFSLKTNDLNDSKKEKEKIQEKGGTKKKKKGSGKTSKKESNEFEKLRDILHEQLKKKNMQLDNKLRKRQSEKNKLEEDVQNIGLELYRINKEHENLQKKEQEIANSLHNLQIKKSNYIKQKIELEELYAKELNSFKREVSYYAEIYNKYNNNLLDANNLRKYYEFMSSNTKISENVVTSDKLNQIKEAKLNKKENITTKLNYHINKITNHIHVQRELNFNEEKQREYLEKALQEEKKELQLLIKEKKKIMKKLNESIGQMKKRDEAICEINNKMEELKNNIGNLENEHEQLQKEYTKEVETSQRLNNELKYTQKEIRKTNKQKESSEKYIEEIKKQNTSMKSQIEKEKKNYEEISNEIKNVTKEIKNKENQIRNIRTEINKNIDKILGIYIDEIKVNHFSNRIKKEVATIKESINKKENEVENYKNAIIKIHIQLALENSKIENMKKKLSTLTEEFKENNNVLLNFESIVVKNHYLIESKQVEVDRLNKEYDKKNKKNDDDVNKPLTLEIKKQKLNKQIDDILKDSRQLEKQWFLKQSELVKIQNENVKIEDEIMKNKDLCVILNQKKCELQEYLNNEQQMKKKINKNIVYIRLQLERFASKSNEMVQKIKVIENEILKWNENLNIKAEKDRQKKESITNEINELKKEKMQYQQDMLDFENEILIMENKIMEERKLQELIKECAENKDVINLRKEIQQKNALIENLKKQQNTILGNIKMALSKRDDLDNKKDVVQKNYESGVNISFKIQHEISLIKKSFVTSRNKKDQLNNKLSDLINMYNALLQQSEQKHSEIKNLHEEYDIFEGIMKVQKYEKDHRFQELLKFQRAAKNANLYENSKISYTTIRENCSTYKKKFAMLQEKLEEFNKTNENYGRCISIIIQWILH